MTKPSVRRQLPNTNIEGKNSIMVVFSSNYLNHHQLFLAQAFLKHPDVDFYFIANEKTPRSRLSLGYDDMNDQYPFVVRAYESKEALLLSEKLAIEADLFISGFSDKQMKNRLKLKKPSFRVTENFFKDFGGKSFKTSNFYFFLTFMKHILPFKGKDVEFLSCSSNLLDDLNRFSKFPNRVLKWGYFPEHIERGTAVAEKNSTMPIVLWVGRMISWKHPDDLINACSKLKDLQFSVVFIGDGPLKPELERLAEKLALSAKISFLGSMNYKEVRSHMCKSDIFVFTSDRNEGWGAVLNEAMDSGCACIASNDAGSTRYLIQDSFNGLTYKTGEVDHLASQLEKLIKSKTMREKLGRRAYSTIRDEWNASVACRRLLEYFKSHRPFDFGPCSEDR